MSNGKGKDLVKDSMPMIQQLHLGNEKSKSSSNTLERDSKEDPISEEDILIKTSGRHTTSDPEEVDTQNELTMNNMDSNNVFTKERVYNIEDVEERNSAEK